MIGKDLVEYRTQRSAFLTAKGKVHRVKATAAQRNEGSLQFGVLEEVFIVEVRFELNLTGKRIYGRHV